MGTTYERRYQALEECETKRNGWRRQWILIAFVMMMGLNILVMMMSSSFTKLIAGMKASAVHAPPCTMNTQPICYMCSKVPSLDGYVMFDNHKCWEPNLFQNRTLALPSHLLNENVTEAFQSQHFHFVGDSIARLAMYTMYMILSRRTDKPVPYEDTPLFHQREYLVGAIRISFEWAPQMEDLLQEFQRMQKLNRPPSHVLFIFGMHEIYRHRFFSHFKGSEFVESLSRIIDPTLLKDVTFQTSPSIDLTKMTLEKISYAGPNFNTKNITDFNKFMAKEISQKLPYLSVLDGQWQFTVPDQNDGKHSGIHAWYTIHRYLWLCLWKMNTQNAP